MTMMCRRKPTTTTDAFLLVHILEKPGTEQPRTGVWWTSHQALNVCKWMAWGVDGRKSHGSGTMVSVEANSTLAIAHMMKDTVMVVLLLHLYLHLSGRGRK
jgi:hypothetical protein